MPLSPRADLKPKASPFDAEALIEPEAYASESEALIKPEGYREYDARWWYGLPDSERPPEIDLKGVQALGQGLATFAHEFGVAPRFVVGHDYAVVDSLSREYVDLRNAAGSILGQRLKDIITVNGARVVLEDGTWGLVRASSNEPSLVVVVESPSSQERMAAMFRDIEARLARRSEVGAFDQAL